MISILRKYPCSIALLLLIGYLSFFHPPSPPKLVEIIGIDKLVHLGMYATFSGMLWLEYFLSHTSGTSMRTGWWICTVFPFCIGGITEIGQWVMTDYRSGDWYDFAANTLGVLLAASVAHGLVRQFLMPIRDRCWKKSKEEKE